MLGVGMVVNGTDIDVNGVSKHGMGTGTGGVDGVGVQGVVEGGVGVVGCGRGWFWHGQYGHGYG